MNQTISLAFRGRLYQGWKVHIGAFICTMIASGCTSYIFGLFVIPVTADLQISRSSVNNGFIALLLGAGILSPIVGRLLDRVSARLVIASGALSFGFGMMLISAVEDPRLMLLCIFLPISYGIAACGTLAGNTVVVRWFERRRGKALGAFAVATSAGGALFTPLTAFMIEQFGWRDALLVIGCIAIVAVSSMALWFIRNHPRGDEPGYFDEFAMTVSNRDVNVAQEAEDRPESYAALLKNRQFWLLTLGIGLLYGSDQAMITANVPYFQDIGIDLSAAALIASCMTVSAIAGKLLVGHLADKVDLRHVFNLVAIAHLAILAIYLMTPPYWFLLITATLFGVGIGGVFPVWATLLAALFGAKNYGMVMGLMTILLKVISILCVRLIGLIHDSTGSYAPAFLLFGSAVIIAMLAVALLPPQRSQARPLH